MTTNVCDTTTYITLTVCAIMLVSDQSKLQYTSFLLIFPLRFKCEYWEKLQLFHDKGWSYIYLYGVHVYSSSQSDKLLNKSIHDYNILEVNFLLNLQKPGCN